MKLLLTLAVVLVLDPPTRAEGGRDTAKDLAEYILKPEETGAWQPVEVVKFTDFDDLEVKFGGKTHKAFLVGLRPLREGDKDRVEQLRKDMLTKLQKNALSARVVTTRGEAVGLSLDAFSHHANDFGHGWDPGKYPYCWSGWGAYNLNAYFLHAGVTRPADTFGRNARYREQFAAVVKKIEGKDGK
jgi:hypothetical protein